MGENRGMTTTAETTTDILDVARAQVLERGEALTQAQIVEVLRTGDDRLADLLALAHEVRDRSRHSC